MSILIFLCAVASVHDGDTFKCRDGVSVRLANIDAPEIGACRGRRGRVCVPGDGQASRRALMRLAIGKTVRCRKSGMSYKRVVAWCAVGGVDISCSLYRSGMAARAVKYDTPRRLCTGRF